MSCDGAARIGAAPISRSLALAVFEEPLVDQRVERAVSLQLGQRGIERRDEIRAGRQDEAERLGLDRLATCLKAPGSAPI